ncbi:glycosyltransferase family 1 protein [Dothidotthia symphoricarpi CBS 119687]|uniref:Glycosyltransferase family 1 protein n=1 Tax=Dothidotthia symphoricarpi CBS 119687 TaxID=1392245 RepID=A0A6A6A535_9PLEO|nr:glycosyltransferase family 1 protein [Dothidotthia symphoricarpi CBS 119687]KAF2125711.1 glycosyltransferase family 1 protein [Dothidotthia symphoricarpi CBS 119687]
MAQDTSPHAPTQRASTTHRPAQWRSASERPKPSTKHSLLGRLQQKQHHRAKDQVQLERSTMSFDPYSSASESDSDSSSSSSSSSDDDTPFPTRSTTRDEATTRQERRARRPPNPFSRLKAGNEHFKTKGRVSKADGRLKLSILEEDGNGYIAKALGAVLKKHTAGDEDQTVRRINEHAAGAAKIAPEDDEMENDPARRIHLNVVIIIIGSRGDIQPFIRIGKILQNDYGHRVRIATHPAFKDFVEKDAGLEFFSINGNPAELMAFMVKNPGLIPNMDTIKDGEIGRRRAQMYEMFQGMWRACINCTDDDTDSTNAKMLGDKAPFVADAIIANPPSFAPPHIAEKLGIPLHMMFTFPYTPTVQFPHPLANIKSSNVEPTYSNFISYPLVDMMTWQGLGDLINRFRTRDLHLEEVSTLWAPGQLYRLKVPYTYMWSPGLVPKPKDWGPEIDISGFTFLDLASSFTPPDDLTAFLDKGEPPVYIGFGSIVVDDPDAFTKLIFEAVELAGVRALVSKGWGGFGSNADCPDNIFMLDNIPHDWLFPRCSAVIHHGGAGTTAIGLKCAKPTMIVPFFGDQPFWGAMVSKAKAGAHECIPYKKLDAECLAKGIKQCLTEEAKTNVKKIADNIEAEGDGAMNAVRSFHRSLPLTGEASMRCDFLDNRAAAWKLKNTNVKLSALAAEILVEKKKLKWSELRLIRHYEWNDFGGPGEPVTGLWGSLVGTLTDAVTGVGGVPVEMGKSIKKRERIWEKKRRIQKRQQHKDATLAKANADLPNATHSTHNDASSTSKDNTSKSKTKDSASDKKGDNKRPKPERGESTLSTISEPDEELREELAHEAAFGFRKTGHAIARLPMNLTLALTQGFHNAPRLYGDETVRRPPRVTGFHSGMRAGRDELLYGVMDGVSGIVTQPIRGAKQGGMLGALNGVGLGIGGFVLKDIAAIFGPFAYTMKGLDAEYMKKYQPTSFIRRARIAQGQVELQALEPGSRVARMREAKKQGSDEVEVQEDVERNINERWKALQEAIAQDKTNNRTGVMGSLLGRGEKKEGQHVPRKSKSFQQHDGGTVHEAMTMPVAPAEEQFAKNKNSVDSARARKSIDRFEGAKGLTRSSTAPIRTMETWDKHGNNSSDPASPPSKQRLISDGIQEEAESEGLGSGHILDASKNQSDDEIASGHKGEHGDTTTSFIPGTYIDDARSEDTGSDKTKIDSEPVPTDWVSIRHKAEALGSGKSVGDVNV